MVNDCDIPNYFRIVRYTFKQRIFIVETYLLKKRNYDTCALKFRRRFPGATVPSKSYIIKMFRKWRGLGPVKEKMKGGNYFQHAL